MDEERSKRHADAREARRSRLKPPGAHAPIAGFLYLASVDHCVPVREIDRPDIAALVIEDLCWQIAVADWAARRPRVWRRQERIDWRLEGEVLQVNGDHITTMACEIGVHR